MVNPRVGTVHQRDDNTIEIQVLTDSFKPGQEVEVSGYVTQGDAYAAFNDKKHIPLDANPTFVLNVQLPAMDLKPDETVTVVTRVAEVWPTVLIKDKDSTYVGKGLKAAWTSDYPGKESGGPTAPRGKESSTGTTS